MKMKISYLLYVCVLLSSLLLVSCVPPTKPVPAPTQTPTQPAEEPTTTPLEAELTAPTDTELKKFSSVKEIKDFLEKAGQQQISQYYGGIMRDVMVEQAVPSVGVAAPTASKAMSGGAGAADFSTTNVQVAGVDEADFVKNDNRYIYTIVQDKLVIVDAYPAEKADVLSKTELDGRPINLFVNGDRLAVFTENNDEVYAIPEYGYMPIPRSSQVTHVTIYDISDRKNPEEVEDYTVSGNYYQSRMIGDYVYFITQENVYYATEYIDVPTIRSASKIMVTPDVYYFDIPETNYNFNTVASFSIKDPKKLKAKTFLMGYSNTLFVSKENIYIAYQKNPGWVYYREHPQRRFLDVVVPLLPREIRDEIEGINSNKDLDSYEKWERMSAALEEMYNKMDESAKEELVQKIEDALSDYERKIEIERRKTVIHKIGIDNGNIEYQNRGEVSGYLLNQFSMDEFNGNLRVATTTELYTPYKGSQVFNNVYVLDKGLDVIGKLEGIAPDESIYSTRFVDERLYMVTFKRIDPLFVIDLSDPRNPEVLGKLKIPGYSDYLHPYDKNHIIGIGKETEGNEWGGTSVAGVKLALFDVSDVEHPKEIDHVEIGEPGSDSEALRDHKAFLFDKEKNLLVIPVREVKGVGYVNPMYGYYRQKIWQGAYVFGVSPSTGFEKKGKITHLDGEEDQQYSYYSPSAVRRSLYMDDVLYTVSSTTIKMNDLDTVKEIGEIDLPYKSERYYDYPWWY
jgi:inhibitor of cysteine peptidase